MAGHSKWANIKFRKAAQDKKRGKLFTKLIKEITVAARIGGEIVDTNPRLRTAIDKALSQNMTRDTINRAIKRGAGGQDGADMLEIRYEGYGPAGVAVMVDCLTDNRNRTVADVRHAFTKAGGHLGTDGSVAYLFTKRGIISFAPGIGEEKVLEAVLALTVEDIHSYSDGSVDVITDPDHFIEVRDALEKNNLQPAGAEITMVASNEVSIEDLEVAEKIMHLHDMLEDLDDVQAVYMNAHIASEILSELN